LAHHPPPAAYNVRSFFHYPLMAIVPLVCEDHGIETTETVDRETVDQIVLSMEERRGKDGEPISPATRVAYLNALKYFLEWAEKEGLTRVDGGHIGLAALKKQHKDIFTKEEQRLLETGAKSERNKLIIRVMLETAAREEGVATSGTTDFIERDRRFYFVRVTDKTGTRMPPVSRELYRRAGGLRAGRTGRPRTSNSFLFISARRNRVSQHHEPLGTMGVYFAVKHAAEEVGLDRSRVKPHLLRATAILARR
jgi:site-specific recombinase XerD